MCYRKSNLKNILSNKNSCRQKSEFELLSEVYTPQLLSLWLLVLCCLSLSFSSSYRFFHLDGKLLSADSQSERVGGG